MEGKVKNGGKSWYTSVLEVQCYMALTRLFGSNTFLDLSLPDQEIPIEELSATIDLLKEPSAAKKDLQKPLSTSTKLCCQTISSKESHSVNPVGC